MKEQTKVKEQLDCIMKKLSDAGVGCEWKEGCGTHDGATYAYALFPEFTQDELLSCGIDVYDLGQDIEGVWWDWYSSAVIVIGSDE